MRKNSYKLYRIVSGVIISDNKILLVQNKDENGYYLWSLPGGVVEDGESLEDALFREIYEEVGLKVKEKQLIYIHESFIPEYSAQSLVTVFQVTVYDGNPIPHDPDAEIVQVKWVPINDVQNYITHSAVVGPLKRWLETRKSFYSVDKNLNWDYKESD
jgi:8-oxo-dGTP diphosphatase